MSRDSKSIWQKVVGLDWDRTVNSAEAPEGEAAETKCIVVLPVHLGTVFKILQANGVKVISLSQRNMYKNTDNELAIRARMTGAMDEAWGKKREFLKQEDLESIGNIDGDDASFRNKNGMIVKINKLSGCGDIKPHNFIIVDDNVQYFAPSAELNYQCLHVRRTWAKNYLDFQPFLRLLHLACPEVDIEKEIGQHCKDSKVSTQLRLWWKIYSKSLRTIPVAAKIQLLEDEKYNAANFSWIADHYEFLTVEQKQQVEKSALVCVDRFIQTQKTALENIILGLREKPAVKIAFDSETELKLLQELTSAVTLLNVKTNQFSQHLKSLEELKKTILGIKRLAKGDFTAKIPGLIAVFADDKSVLSARLNAAKMLMANDALLDHERAKSLVWFETYLSSYESLLVEVAAGASEIDYVSLAEKLPSTRKIIDLYDLDNAIAANTCNTRIASLSSGTDAFINPKMHLIAAEFKKINEEIKSIDTVAVFKSRTLEIRAQEKLLNFLAKLAMAFGSSALSQKLSTLQDQAENLRNKVYENWCLSTVDEKIRPEERATNIQALFAEFEYKDQAPSIKIFQAMVELDQLCCQYQNMDEKIQNLQSVAAQLQTKVQTLKADMNQFVQNNDPENTKYIFTAMQLLIINAEKISRKFMSRIDQEKFKDFIAECFNQFQVSIFSQHAKKSIGLLGEVDPELKSALKRVSAHKTSILRDLIREQPTLASSKNNHELRQKLHARFLSIKINGQPSVEDCTKKKIQKSTSGGSLAGFNFRF